MAGSNKKNTLKELFIKIGLIGAKEATKDLKKLDEATEESGKEAKKAGKETDKFGDKLVKLGIVSRKTINGMKEFRKLGPVFKTLNLGIRALKSTMRGTLGIVRKFTSGLSNIFQIATGISLSNIVGSIFDKIRNLGSKSLGLAVDEESTRAGLRSTFSLQGNAAFADRFLKSLDKISAKFGIGATELAKAFQGTSVPLKKLTRAAEIVAKFGILRPDVSPATIARQLSIMMSTGNVEETLKNLAPFLLRMSPEERIAKGFESIEKHLTKISMDSNRTFAFRAKILNARFDELLRTFGRPVRDTLNVIMGRMLGQKGTPTLAALGDAVSRVIATFAQDFFLGKASSGFLNDLNTIGADAIKLGGVLLKDVIDFMLGRKSGLQQIFLPDETPESATVMGLLKSMITELINFAVDRVKAAFSTEDSKKFLKGVGHDIRNGATEDTFLDNFFSPSTKTKDVQDDLYPIGGDGLRPSIPDQGAVNSNTNIPEQVAVNSNTNIPEQGAVNFNTNIQISTQQPATTVRNQLANQMALIGNQGRTA